MGTGFCFFATVLVGVAGASLGGVAGLSAVFGAAFGATIGASAAATGAVSCAAGALPPPDAQAPRSEQNTAIGSIARSVI